MENAFSTLGDLLSTHSFKEGFDVLRIFDFKLNKLSFDELIQLRSNITGIGTLHCDSDDSIQVNLDAAYDETLYEGLILILRIAKDVNLGLFFISEAGFILYLNGPNSETESIRLCFINNHFQSVNCNFLTLNENLPKQTDRDVLSSIKYVRALNVDSQLILPSDILFWVTKEKFINDVPHGWENASSLRLLACLCTEIFKTGERIELIFKGERKKSIFIKNDKIECISVAFKELNDCVSWVYGNSKDIDTRHAIINNQITALLPDQNEIDLFLLNKLLENVLEGSKMVYQYHLQVTSKELNKTLSELNKTLFEYINKIRQNTTDLANNVWKDLTTVLGFLLINFSLKKPELPNSFYDIIGIGLVIYLIFSIALTARIGFWYYNSLTQNLKNWRQKIYSYLTDSEFKTLATIPLNEAHSKYKTTFWFALILYLIMIGATLIFTFEVDIFKMLNNLKSNFKTC